MANQLLSLNTASPNVTTGAYVTLGTTTIPTAALLLTTTTTVVLKIAVGAAGSEVDLFQLPVTGTIQVDLGSLSMVPSGSRLSVRAISATASSGFICVTVLS